MAIKLEFYDLIVPVKTIMKKYNLVRGHQLELLLDRLL